MSNPLIIAAETRTCNTLDRPLGRAVHNREMVLGEEHPDTLESSVSSCLPGTPGSLRIYHTYDNSSAASTNSRSVVPKSLIGTWAPWGPGNKARRRSAELVSLSAFACRRGSEVKPLRGSTNKSIDVCSPS
jgi:hypothetical protein